MLLLVRLVDRLRPPCKRGQYFVGADLNLLMPLFGAASTVVRRRVTEVGHLLRRDADVDVGLRVRAVALHATRTHSEGVQWPSSRCHHHEAHTARRRRRGGTRRHCESRRPLTPHFAEYTRPERSAAFLERLSLSLNVQSSYHRVPLSKP